MSEKTKTTLQWAYYPLISKESFTTNDWTLVTPKYVYKEYDMILHNVQTTKPPSTSQHIKGRNDEAYFSSKRFLFQNSNGIIEQKIGLQS